MKGKKIFYKGTVIIVKMKDYWKDVDTFMLIENNDTEYWFQLVCIKGFKSGNIYGYIKADEYARQLGCRGVTKEHLIRELEEERNLGEIYKSTLRIKPKPNDIVW